MLDALAQDFQRMPPTHPRLAAVRARAFAQARRRGLPVLGEEDWRYTDLGALAATRYPLATASATPRDVILPLAGLAVPRLVFIDGAYSAALSSPVESLTGVACTPLGALLREDPERAAAVLEAGAGEETPALAALNAALTPDGVSLEVGSGAAPALLLMFVAIGESQPALVVPRVAVRVRENAEFTLVEAYCGGLGARNFTNAVTDIELERGARLHHFRLQDEASDAIHIGALRLRLGADAEARSYSFAYGGRLSRIDVDATLAAPGASLHLNGLFLAGAGQHIDHYTRIDHAAGSTQSAELYKGLADSDGRGVFRGKIVVRPDAQKISATQASHNLLLSALAEIDTRPELEIYADDVSCAHGATVGQLDEQALFYLRARGIPERDARQLLVQGFAQQITEEVAVPALREWLDARLRQRVIHTIPEVA